MGGDPGGMGGYIPLMKLDGGDTVHYIPLMKSTQQIRKLCNYKNSRRKM